MSILLLLLNLIKDLILNQFNTVRYLSFGRKTRLTNIKKFGLTNLRTNGPSDYRAVTHATRHAVGIKNQLHAINATNGFTQLVWEYQHLCMKLFQTHQYHGHVTLQTIPQYCMNQSCLFQTRSQVYRLAYITSQVTHPSVNSENRQQHRHPKE